MGLWCGDAEGEFLLLKTQVNWIYAILKSDCWNAWIANWRGVSPLVWDWWLQTQPHCWRCQDVQGYRSPVAQICYWCLETAQQTRIGHWVEGGRARVIRAASISCLKQNAFNLFSNLNFGGESIKYLHWILSLQYWDLYSGLETSWV